MFVINFVLTLEKVMTEVTIVKNPSEKLLKLIAMMKEKKNADQKKLAELKNCTFTITV